PASPPAPGADGVSYTTPSPPSTYTLSLHDALPICDWIRDLERRGASPWIVRNARAALSVMLGCAVEDGDIGSNPAAGVRYVPSEDRKSTRLNSSHRTISYAVFCLKKKNTHR